MKRVCGGCTLCCKLVPVTSLDKPAGQRCRHQSATGCRVHHDVRRGFPIECGVWDCGWLGDPKTARLKRPDRTHYVIDPYPDLVRVDGQEVRVIQVWLDPHFPDAWQDPALLDYIEKAARPMLVRLNREDGFAVFPPAVTGNGRFAVSGRSQSTASITGNRLLDQLAAISASPSPSPGP